MPGDHLMFSLYFAGELFNAKHLIGNSALGCKIRRHSLAPIANRLSQRGRPRRTSLESNDELLPANPDLSAGLY